MLGRLRMTVDDSIAEYWKLSNYIFRPRKYVFPYSSQKLEEAINGVVRKYCGCQHQECGDQEEFRQYDYAEEGDPGADLHLNRTCKV